MRSPFFNDHNHSRQLIYQAIMKQVVAEYELEFVQAIGWRKYWVKWKIAMVVEIRYKRIVFLEQQLNSHN